MMCVFMYVYAVCMHMWMCMDAQVWGSQASSGESIFYCGLGLHSKHYYLTSHLAGQQFPPFLLQIIQKKHSLARNSF